MHSSDFSALLMIILWLALFSAGLTALWTVGSSKKPFIQKNQFWIMVPLSLIASALIFPLLGSVDVLSARIDARQAHRNIHQGWVAVPNSDRKIRKMCDNTTLLYSNGGVIPNSPECK